MFYIIEGADGQQNINMTRGDSQYVPLEIYDKKGDPVIPRECDTVRVQVRDKPSGGWLAFEGLVYMEGDEVIWRIRPDDTRKLRPGMYYWDAQIELPDSDDVFTFIPLSEFNILDESTQRPEV